MTFPTSPRSETPKPNAHMLRALQRQLEVSVNAQKTHHGLVSRGASLSILHPGTGYRAQAWPIRGKLSRQSCFGQTCAVCGTSEGFVHSPEQTGKQAAARNVNICRKLLVLAPGRRELEDAGGMQERIPGCQRGSVGNLTSQPVGVPGRPARDGLHEESWGERPGYEVQQPLGTELFEHSWVKTSLSSVHPPVTVFSPSQSSKAQRNPGPVVQSPSM